MIACCRSFAFALLAALFLLPIPSARAMMLPDRWPEPSDSAVTGQPVTFDSSSPFALADIGAGPRRDPPTVGQGTLFLPPAASAAQPAPAVILLHGAAGVSASRELAYGRQLAAMGVAVLAVDSFAARRGRASGFVERLLNITEMMLVADAYAGLRYLDARPEVDGRRVALVGFSYGGMATTFAAFAQVAERAAPDGQRFAGHVAFYAPCVARFEDRRTTGAPFLMLIGGADEITDQARCAEVAADLEAGGSAVEAVIYEGAYHQWDGGRAVPRRMGRNLAPCALTVTRDGVVRDRLTLLPMTGPVTRRLILAACTDGDGYMIGRDDAARRRSNAALGAFLSGLFWPAPEPSGRS